MEDAYINLISVFLQEMSARNFKIMLINLFHKLLFLDPTSSTFTGVNLSNKNDKLLQ